MGRATDVFQMSQTRENGDQKLQYLGLRSVDPRF
jgi:hypothetical protein